jgi:hypothetical protein
VRSGRTVFVRHPRAILVGAMALTLALTWYGQCWAYIDPNAGGFLVQILAPLGAVFLSLLFYCRRQIRRFVKSVRDRWKAIESRQTVPEAKE